MAKLGIYKYFSFMLLVITLLISIFTIIGLFGGNANPVHETAMALIVYALPLLIIANFITLLFWIIRRRWHWVVIPSITLLCCIPFIGTLFQFGFWNDEDEPESFTVSTYNVALFGRELTGFKAEDILSAMKRQNVSILCIQEYMTHSGNKDNTENYKKFFGNVAKGKDDMIIFSRYPIVDSKCIDFNNKTNNSAMWADVNVLGKTIRVFNVHLETTGINSTLHKAAKREIAGNPIEENALVRAFFDNYTLGMVNRAIQANIVAKEIQSSPYPVIVCGDFNDVPYSYVYNTMKGNLVDGFKECGKGFMYTMRGNKKIRIDYIFHDESLSGLSYHKEDLSYSDHYPVFMKLKY